MNAKPPDAAKLIRRDSFKSAASTFVINAAISTAQFAGRGPHRITVDSIATREATVFSSAVPLAVVLAVIAATTTFFAFRKKAVASGIATPSLLSVRYLPFGLAQALSASLSVFGAVVAAGVLWQRAFGEVTVGTPVAGLFAGLVAALTAWYATRRTAWALLRESRSIRPLRDPESTPTSDPDDQQ